MVLDYPVKRNPFLTAGIILFLLAVCSLQAKTRWSALHFVPDADFLSGGQFVADGEGYYFNDTAAKAVLNPAVLLNIGIMEWVNFEGGYAGGPTVGFKARILGESGNFAPSIAIGAHNIVSNKDAGLFSRKDTLTNEVYLAVAKSIEPLKLRVHLGFQTIPKSKNDQFDPYFALEEYFGSGLYGSIEVFKRDRTFNPSLFVSYRFLKKHLEVAAGAVRINRLFFDKNNQFKFALGDTGVNDFVKPGIWFGLRYFFSFRFGKNDAFSTVEDRVSRQNETIKALSLSVDSLKLTVAETRRRMYDVNTTLVKMTDSLSADKTGMKPFLLGKITTLKNLYAEEPFDPERVRHAVDEVVALRENALPGLREILLDKTLDKHIRVLTVILLGDIGSAGASDILLDVLSQTQDPDVKIEICIAFGKIRETRAEYVLEQLANDPVDAVAFTAQEVLLKLTKETGMKLSQDAKMRTVVIPEPPAIVETKMKTQHAADTAKAKAPSDTGKKSAGVTKQAAGLDVWDVGHPQDSARVQSSPKDSSRSQAKAAVAPKAQPDSSRVAKLDSLLTATTKDKTGDKKDMEKKAKTKKPAAQKSAEVQDNKSW